MPTLIDRIEAEMLADDEDREEQSYQLVTAYQKADAAGKDAIDMCFIALCGWSLTTFLKQEG